ncbi:DUF456 domain-containing protein [Flavobacteriales bacterium]|nr:DUF456 domain-containing protein [Flavobacteriales bacterium]
MEILIIIGIVILLLLGVIGSVIPALPGPPLSYIALLLFHFFINSLDGDFLLWIGVVVVLVTILDYYLQIYGVKKAGGGKYAIRGSIVGMLLGIFLFPPSGILVGAFVGAYMGAKMEASKHEVKIAFGALWGFIAGTILKLCTSFYIIYILLF